jgi:hypothetical protein
MTRGPHGQVRKRAHRRGAEGAKPRASVRPAFARRHCGEARCPYPRPSSGDDMGLASAPQAAKDRTCGVSRRPAAPPGRALPDTPLASVQREETGQFPVDTVASYSQQFARDAPTPAGRSASRTSAVIPSRLSSLWASPPPSSGAARLPPAGVSPSCAAPCGGMRRPHRAPRWRQGCARAHE